MKKSFTTVLWIGIPLFALALAVYVLLPPVQSTSVPQAEPNTQTSAVTPADGLQTTTFPQLQGEHIQQGEKVAYNSNPPTSGRHLASARSWGIYDQTLADEGALHNLEHGGIWITYRPDLDPDAVFELQDITTRYPNAVVMSPRAENDSPIAIVSWGRIMPLQTLDTTAVDLYIRTYVNNSPEKFASLDQTVSQNVVELVNGKVFPSFNLTDVDGASVSLSTLAGKPAIVWFTTGWCVPCQIGAKEVAKLDAELGGDAFDVIVVFVDPREDAQDLRDWKQNFAAPDWQVAFDDASRPLSTKIGLQFLDSKYLLDANGVLLNQDFRIADDTYLATIRRIVEGS
jgi:cytochrome oxidase Cu insertion factor (SCO1/SenC/PrrC family)